MDDLDSLLAGELASIDQVFQEFEVKDKKTEQRILTEEEELKNVKAEEVDEVAPSLDLLEQVSKRRSLKSVDIERQWEEEMQALEKEDLKAMQQQKERADSDTVFLQNLDNELKSLIQTKEEDMKLAHQDWLVREQKLKADKVRIEREAMERIERKERKQKERLERLANSDNYQDQEELTVEEWIQYLEEKKKQGMTPAQLEEYERRKKARQEKDRERTERLREEEEEKRKKTKEKMDREMRSYRQRQMEIEEARISEKQLRQNQEEMAQRQQEESRLRKERGEKMRREDKAREIEDLKPKARSALAARWEESVKKRTNGKGQSRDVHKSTVLSGPASEQSALEREEERLIRRISAGFPNGGTKLSPDKLKRKSTGDIL